MNRSELPVDEILEGLDLSRAEPGIGFLEALFTRFNSKVPFETASKIVRNAEVADAAEKPRWPAVFWREHLEKGAGGTCFARVAAFDALLGELGFSTRKVFGRVERDFDHAALLVSDRGRLWICDVGFPLPALLPAGESRVETSLVELSVAVTPRGFRVDFSSGVPEGPRSVEIFGEDVSEEEFRKRWRATFRPDSRFLSAVALRRQEASRVVSFVRGEVRVDDRHSRLTVPLAERRERLAEMFGIDGGLLERAFSLAGDPQPEGSGSRLTAYLEVAAAAPAAFALIGRPEGYRRLLEGVVVITAEEKTPSGWRLALASPGAGAASAPEATLFEELAPDPARSSLRVRRSAQNGPAFESEFRVEERGGRTYLVREAIFDTPREDLLRNDSLRGRLAGTLAVDLLAWARLIGAGVVES
jgi:arylamine N-acetyltransferase